MSSREIAPATTPGSFFAGTTNRVFFSVLGHPLSVAILVPEPSGQKEKCKNSLKSQKIAKNRKKTQKIAKTSRKKAQNFAMPFSENDGFSRYFRYFAEKKNPACMHPCERCPTETWSLDHLSHISTSVTQESRASELF